MRGECGQKSTCHKRSWKTPTFNWVLQWFLWPLSIPWHFLFFGFCPQFYCKEFGWAECLQREKRHSETWPLSPVSHQCLLVGGESHYCHCCWAGTSVESRDGGLWDSLMTPGEMQEEGCCLGSGHCENPPVRALWEIKDLFPFLAAKGGRTRNLRMPLQERHGALLRLQFLSKEWEWY